MRNLSILFVLTASIFASGPSFADEPKAGNTDIVDRTEEVGPLIPYRSSRARVSLLIPYRVRGKPVRSPASASR